MDGTQVLLGVPPEGLPRRDTIRILANRPSLAASNIAGMAETQEILGFCAKHGLTADINQIDAASLKSMPFADTRA